MKLSNGFLFALILIFVFALIQPGFVQEKEETITNQQDQSEKDLKLQEEKKPEESKSPSLEKAQQEHDYDVAEILRESQRNVDRALNILSLVATVICGFIALFTIALMIAGLTGFFSYRRWAEMKKTVDKDVRYIREIRDKAEEDINAIRREIDEKSIPSLPEEATEEFKEKLDEFSRKLEFFEFLGLPLKPEDFVNRGWDLIYKKNLEFALKAFEKALELEPSNQRAWFGKGYALGKLDRHEEGLKAYDKAIELKPDYFAAWNNKGNALRRLSRYEEALKAYEKAIELKPDNAEAWNNKGTALGDLDRHEEELKAYDKAIELKPDYFAAWFNKACLFSLKGDKKNALLNLTKAIELNAKCKEVAKTDEDFKSLRDDPDFKKLTC